MSMGTITFGLGGVPEAQRYRVTTSASDTLRQRIIDAIDARLKTITIANNYKTDIKDADGNPSVYAWEEFGLDDDRLPALVYKDVDEEPDQVTVDNVDNTLTVEVYALAIKGTTSEAKIREMISDVIKCVGVDETWGNLAEFTLLPTAAIAVDQPEKKIFGAQVNFIVEYQSERFNSFA